MFELILTADPLYLSLIISIAVTLLVIPFLLYKKNKAKTEQQIISNEYSIASSMDLEQYAPNNTTDENTATTESFSSIISPNFDQDSLTLSHALTFDGAGDRERALQVLEIVTKQETHEKEKLRLTVIYKNYAKSQTKLMDLLNKYPSFKKHEISPSNSVLDLGLDLKQDDNQQHKTLDGIKSNEVWVNWMVINNGKMSLKNSFIKLESNWGDKDSMEELQGKISQLVGIEEDGTIKPWAILSIHEISK